MHIVYTMRYMYHGFGSIFTLVNVYVDLVYLRVLPVLYRPEVVDIGVYTM